MEVAGQMVEMKIVFDAIKGRVVQVTGPLDNRFLCYGMLAEARDVVRKHSEKPRGSVVEARGTLNGVNGTRM